VSAEALHDEGPRCPEWTSVSKVKGYMKQAMDRKRAGVMSRQGSDRLHYKKDDLRAGLLGVNRFMVIYST
jgi:hypothetical protein